MYVSDTYLERARVYARDACPVGFVHERDVCKIMCTKEVHILS